MQSGLFLFTCAAVIRSRSLKQSGLYGGRIASLRRRLGGEGRGGFLISAGYRRPTLIYP